MSTDPTPPTPPTRSALARWADRGLTVVSVALLLAVGYKYLGPRGSAPLEHMAGVRLPGIQQVTLLEIGQTHCPSCVASQPILALVRQVYQPRVRVRVLNLDGGPDAAEARRLAELARVRVTPTFLVTDAQGTVTARFLGPTSYAALGSALDHALGRP